MKNRENIEQLLRQFMNKPDAKQAAQDVHTGEGLFVLHPLPAVSERVLTSIRSRVRAELRRQRMVRFAARFSAAAVLLVALSAGLFWVTSHQPQTPPQQGTYAVARSGNLLNELMFQDALVNALETELTDVAQSMDDLRKETPDDAGSLSIDLLELEELETLASNTDFWKG